MKYTIKTKMLLVVLMMGATMNVWAQGTPTLDPANIIINKIPQDITKKVIVNDEEQEVTEVVGGSVKAVTSADISYSTTNKEWTVKLTITEIKSGYNISASTITVEPMINANLAPRRGESMLSTTRPVTDIGNNQFTFTLPDNYNGANVTVRFFTTQAGFTQVYSLDELKTKINADPSGSYELMCDIDASGFTGFDNFTGRLDGGLHTIMNLSVPLFKSVSGAIIRNVILDKVNIYGGDANGNTGAIVCVASGASRIYNCGILEGSVGGPIFVSGSSTSNVGGIAGKIEGTSRVINCYSYANITGGTTAAGIVGNNSGTTTLNSQTTMVMNCMFYGNITGGTTMKPVYGGNKISNSGATGVNGYNYYRNGSDVTFDDNYGNFDAYYCTLPADEEYLTRFEYYRSILNSNRKLCTWWINGTSETAPTDADVETVGIAKWVLDPSIAPYPILKKWGKYPSVINQDAEYVWNPKTKNKVNRATAEPYQGKKLGTISVTVNPGAKAATGITTTTLPSVVVMDMDTLNHDYCYAKIQLPYYNEVFGDPSVVIPATTETDYTTKWKQRYAGNYTDYVVTGWKITAVADGESGSFKGYAVASNGAVSSGAVSPDDTSGKPWEDGFNFADRNCTNKDLYSKSGRVFAQGGYYYVPEGVTAITIEAYWGKAVYLHNKDHSLDRVDVANGDNGSGADFGTAFSPAGTLPTKFQNINVQTTLQEAISQLTKSASLTVYDQAIVLVGNVQVKNRSQSVGRDNTASNSRPFTIMSIDEDMDNEPDYCLEFQFRQTTDRPGIHPVRFDFLPVPELGLAIRAKQNAYAIGIFIPQGHFEITETSFMHTTQFEYDGNVNRVESPIILNGGHFEQIVVRYGPKNKVNYFLLGGHFRMKRFTPGYHASQVTGDNVRHCVVNAIGGDYPEFYLSGIYRPELGVNADNPHCYINGGRFGTLAGAGYEQVDGNVTFKIDHAVIDKFYGGGMNGAKPVTGNIDVTINNSIVYDIFCGGPMVGKMTKPDGGTRKTVTTTAENTIFGQFFGGGNGGTSYYREQKYDNDTSWPSDWKSSTYKFTEFNPLNTVSGKTKQYDADKGYHDMFEFEVFNSSNGLNANCVARTFIQWAQFGTTITGTVTNTLTNCTVEGNFYGGGNLGTVDGDVISTLTNTHVKGSVFGAGYSAEIPRFRMHDVNKVHVPTRNKAGLIDEQGYLEYVQDNGQDRYYRWTNDDNDGSATTDAPTYWSDTDNEYKCYTPISLVGLGEVSGSVTLTIDGTTIVGESVYGGGEESVVDGDTDVTIESGTIGVQGKGGYRWGNVYGGGKGKIDDETAELVMNSIDDVDAGQVKGNTNITINGGSILHNVYGGGAVGSVGTFNRNAQGLPTECTSGGQTTVTINGGTIGHQRYDTGMINGSSRGWEGNPEGSFLNQLAWVNNTNVIIGAEDPEPNTSSTEDPGPTILGSVYGGGENGHNFENAVITINKGTIGNSAPEATDYDNGNIYGAGCGTDTYWVDANNNGEVDDGEDGHHNQMAGIVQGTTKITVNGGTVGRNIYGGGSMGSVGGNANVSGAGKTNIAINGGTIGFDGGSYGYVFGGPKGNIDDTEVIASVRETLVNINAHPTDTTKDPLIRGSVFGGGEAGIVKENVVVNMNGGHVVQDVYGGGALANTNTDNWDATKNSNAGGWADGKSSEFYTTAVNLHGGTIDRNAYGGGLGRIAKDAIVAQPAVYYTAEDAEVIAGTKQIGDVKTPAVEAQDAVIGIEAKVYGNTMVKLNETPTQTNDVNDFPDNCVVKGSIFGCNNLNGSPQGTTTVHVYKTQDWEGHERTALEDIKKPNATHTYDVAAVYGGGNLAAYEPVELTNASTNVIIDGCNLTSIKQVYGGGNAASSPATRVTVNGTYEIEELFGGGNGKDDITRDEGQTMITNPGANVGFRDYWDYNKQEDKEQFNTKDKRDPTKNPDFAPYIYGTGTASVNIFGGTVHRVFGGSNTRGNVRVTAVTMLEEEGGCDFCVDEAYGGGKSAPMDAEAKLLMACIPGLDAAYGGAEAADIQGNVTLNITNGTFQRVFGGNNLSGTINGSITVNIEETGCRPIIIGELYGGGNEAAYSVYGYNSDGTVKTSGDSPKDDPQVNVKAFTSIGTVYGGGYGESAVMVGSPTVNINVAVDPNSDAQNKSYTVIEDNVSVTKYYSNYAGETKTIDGHEVVLPSHVKGEIGAIQNVFGGGNAAEVKGNTLVNIGTATYVFMAVNGTMTVGETDVSSYYTLNNGNYVACASGDKAAENTTYYQRYTVVGADIRGNVYGGGNNAEVTGNTNVIIGKETTE